ncbi:MAG: hypothetical protein ABFS45_07700 [Pseudomonadota bacterium]
MKTIVSLAIGAALSLSSTTVGSTDLEYSAYDTAVMPAGFDEKVIGYVRGYSTDILLQEDYHDWSDSEAQSGLESVEMAVFEFTPHESSDGRPEELIPLD